MTEPHPRWALWDFEAGAWDEVPPENTPGEWRGGHDYGRCPEPPMAILNMGDHATQDEVRHVQQFFDAVRADGRREGAAEEASRWRRLPGAYRYEDGHAEVVVSPDEPTGFVIDQSPRDDAEGAD